MTQIRNLLSLLALAAAPAANGQSLQTIASEAIFPSKPYELVPFDHIVKMDRPLRFSHEEVFKFEGGSVVLGVNCDFQRGQGTLGRIRLPLYTFSMQYSHGERSHHGSGLISHRGIVYVDAPSMAERFEIELYLMSIFKQLR